MQNRLNRKFKFIKIVFLCLFVLGIAAYSSYYVIKLLYPIKYNGYVQKYSQQNSLDPFLVFAVIKAESGFRPDAISHRNARGLMQISEGTGIWGAANLKIDKFTVELLYDPEINISIGCWYLRRLLKEFDGNTDLAVAAYNCGSGKVNEWLLDGKISAADKLDKIPYPETENFLKRVRNYRHIYKLLYEKQ